MENDNNNNNNEKQAPKQKELEEKAKHAKSTKSYSDIISTIIHEAEEVFDLQNKTVFLSAIIAGLEIGFSYFLCCGVYYFWEGSLPDVTIFRLFGIVYPVGFIMAIMGKSALFTEHTSVLVLPVLNKQRSIWQLLRIWVDVIVGNIIGGILFVLFISYLAPQMNLFTHATMAHIGEHVMGYNTAVLFASALIAGWLMGILAWMISSTANSITRFIIIYMVTGIIGLGGFHHSIVGSLEAFGGLLFSHNISFSDYILFLVLTLLGNSVGGGIVLAFSKYGVFKSNFFNR